MEDKNHTARVENSKEYLVALISKIESGEVVGVSVVTTDNRGVVSMDMPLIPS